MWTMFNAVLHLKKIFITLNFLHWVCFIVARASGDTWAYLMCGIKELLVVPYFATMETEAERFSPRDSGASA